jgi:hypothetical protein
LINANNFTPFFGVIEDVEDPLRNGRYRVRVYGYNSDNRGLLPTENLKWFITINNNSAASSGIGDSPTGYIVGSFVFGYYIDKDKQEGIIVGAVNGMPGGVNDVSPIATGEGGAYLNALKAGVASGVVDARGESWSEPVTKYATKYPKNRVYQSQSGHVVEFDDTPGAERIMIHHKSGSFDEFHPNGTRVSKSVAESFEIHLGGHNILVNGNLNLVSTGDYRVSVGGEMYVKAANVVFDTPNVDIYGISNANDHISSNVSGAYHIHDGVQPGNGVSASPVGASTAFSPSPANAFAMTIEDSGFTPDVIEFALKEGFLTPDDIVQIETAQPTIDQIDESPVVEKKPVITDCGLAIDASGKVDYTVNLTSSITLRDVSLGAVVSQYAIIDQAGYSKDEIICNLKNLAENVLQPLKDKYPNMMITSAFRHGSGKSQHERGEAVDIQFRNVTNAFYFQVAQWIKANLPHDQLILEGKNFGTKMPWIHISLTRNKKQRYQVMTFFNHKKVADGLQNIV